MNFCRCSAGLLVLALAGCHQGPPPNTYRIAMESDFRSLDPLKLNTGIEPASNLYDALVAYPPQGSVPLEKLTEIVPDLAQRWEMSKDGRTYTFHLRPGVRFHSGRALAAADVQYSIERILDPANASTGLWTGKALTISGLDAFQEARKTNKSAHLSGVAVPDANTVVIQLDGPVPFALHLLAMPYFYVVPHEEVEKYGAEFTRHPVGTGPFRFQEWVQGQYLQLERNPDYFEAGKPYLQAIRFQIMPGEAQRYLSYLNGELEETTIPQPELESVLNDKKLNAAGPKAILSATSFIDPSRSLILKAPSFSTFYLGMVNGQQPFGDVRVRQAFNYAIDRHRLASQILAGRAIEAKGVLPPSFPGYDAGRPQRYPYDPHQAKSLLRAAGWRQDREGMLHRAGKPLAATLWFSTVDSVSQQVVAAVQADLKAVGVDVDVRGLNQASFMDKVDRRETPFFRLSWQADYPDPDNFLWTLFDSRNIGQSNRAQFSDPDTDALLEKARQTGDWPTRQKLYRQAESRIVDLAPWVFLYHSVNYKLIQPWVRNQGLHPLPVHYLKEVRIERQQ